MKTLRYLPFALCLLAAPLPAAEVPVGPLGYGVTAPEGASGVGYLLYSVESIHSRFQSWANQADHFMAVQWDGGQWLQFENENSHPFTPAAGDVLVAALDYTNDTATLLVGEFGTVHGIDKGLLATDLVITPNWWNGAADPNEFGLAGTVIDVPDRTAPAWWSEGTPPAVDPAATGADNLAVANVGQGKWMAMSAMNALKGVLSPDDITLLAIEDALYLDPSDPGDLGVFDPSAPAAPDQAWRDLQHAPLQVGALKAIAYPFYKELNTLNPKWVEGQLFDNGLVTLGMHYHKEGDFFYPWNPADNGDAEKNRSPATLGQVKLLFAFDLASLGIDTDGDGIPDHWESGFGLDPADPTDASTDPDGDLISSLAEYLQRTDPLSNADGDGDGIPDDWEVAKGFDPADVADGAADADSDGLVNADEFLYTTDPHDPDTDDDFVTDGVEVHGA